MDLQIGQPIQPTLAPGIVTNPSTPQITRVTSAPQQPTLAPQVASRPANVPTQLPVVNQPQGLGTVTNNIPPLVIAINSARRDGHSDDEILNAYIRRHPESQAPQALKAGHSAKDILDQIIRNHGFDPQYKTQEPQGEQGIKGFGLGAVKGALSTLSSVSSIANKAFSKAPALGLVLPPLAGLAAADKALAPRKENFKPQGTAEKIGFGTEQVAEFLVPAGEVAKGVKVTEAGIDALKLGKLSTTVLKTAVKSLIGAGETAGITALQGGNAKETKTAGAIGAVFPLVGKVLDSIVTKLPETAWTSILKRTPTDAVKNPNLPKQAIKTGLTGLSRESIASKAEDAIQAIEVSLDDLLSKSEGQINTAKVVGYLSDLRTSYAAIPGEEASVKAIDGIATKLYEPFKNGEAMTVLEANQLKRNIYKVIAKSYGKGVFELPAKTEAQKLIASGLKQEIENVVPEVKTLNQRQAVYLQIKKALDKTIARTEGKGIAGTGIGLYDLLLGGIGTGAGAATGNPLLGLGIVAAKKGAESTAVLSATSRLLNYFNELSPTKKLLFYQAIKGLTVRSVNSGAQRTSK